jgi:hypothetical protein
MSRIREIRDCVLKRGRSGTYFENFDASLEDNPVKRKHFLHLEAELAKLDAAAWAHLKTQVLPLFENRDQVRGWQAAFDKLNEAKGYNYLTQLGCVEVAFIPTSTASGRKTPDLQAKLGTDRVLCEVKTINPSDIEAASCSAVAHGRIVSGSTQGALPDGFFCKLMATLKTAEAQMTSYCSDHSSRRIVHVVLNFDDLLNQYADDYLGQIQTFTRTAALPEVEIVLDVKPRFYSATSQSPSSRLFVRSSDGSWAAL